MTELGDPDCSETFQIAPSATCSDACGILPELVSVECGDNGTPSNPSDDTYTFSILVEEANTSGTWEDQNGERVAILASLTPAYS